MFGVAWVAAPAMLDPSRVVLYAVGGFLQLHYVFCLMQFFLIYALWRTRLRNAGATRSLIIAALVSVGIFGGSSLEVWLAGADDGFVEEVLNRVSLTWSVFFFFGVWLGQRPTRLERLARWAPLWLLLTFVLYVPAGLEARHWDLTFGGTPPRMQVLAGSLWYAFMGGLALLTLAYRLDRTRLGRKALRPLSWLGADSMGVYMSHTTFLMLAAYCVIEWGLGQTSWSTVPALGGVALLTSWAFVRLLRLRFLAWPAFVLFGRRPPRRP
jgi:surface polysaccharide O-acyltransferase-like enzyme